MLLPSDWVRLILSKAGDVDQRCHLYERSNRKNQVYQDEVCKMFIFIQGLHQQWNKNYIKNYQRAIKPVILSA